MCINVLSINLSIYLPTFGHKYTGHEKVELKLCHHQSSVSWSNPNNEISGQLKLSATVKCRAAKSFHDFSETTVLDPITRPFLVSSLCQIIALNGLLHKFRDIISRTSITLTVRPYCDVDARNLDLKLDRT